MFYIKSNIESLNMFQQQQSQRKTHIMTPAIASQNEAQAKEK